MQMLSLRNTNLLSLGVERSHRMQRVLMIAEMYRRGVTVEKIAREFDCSKGTVLRVARAFGLEKRERGSAWLRKCAIKAYKRGCSVQGIARHCGRSQAWVSVVAGKAGLLRRRFKPREDKVVNELT